jgi:hypothetical protein
MKANGLLHLDTLFIFKLREKCCIVFWLFAAFVWRAFTRGPAFWRIIENRRDWCNHQPCAQCVVCVMQLVMWHAASWLALSSYLGASSVTLHNHFFMGTEEELLSLKPFVAAQVTLYWVLLYRPCHHPHPSEFMLLLFGFLWPLFSTLLKPSCSSLFFLVMVGVPL